MLDIQFKRFEETSHGDQDRLEIYFDIFQFDSLHFLMVLGKVAQEPLMLPGRMTCLKDFKMPFFERHFKLLLWDNCNRSRTNRKKKLVKKFWS